MTLTDKEIDEYIVGVRESLAKRVGGVDDAILTIDAYIACLEKTPHILFGLTPPRSDGQYKALPNAAELACSEAVLRVLRKRRLTILEWKERTQEVLANPSEAAARLKE